MILIVGGAGYIGSHVNKLLSTRGYRTVVFDNLSRGHREFVRWGEFFHGDLADRERVRLCFNNHPIEAVMHFSAFSTVGESVTDPARYYVNNVANTLNLLETAREYGVLSVIFSSTCAIYGVPEEIPITEDHPRKPINPYGRSKLMIEEMLADYDAAYGMRHVSLRYFNAAGADPDREIGEWHEPETHLIPLVLDAAAGRTEGVKIFGTDYGTPDGTCIRDYIHVDDVAEAHLSALEYLRRNGKSDAFNLGNGKGFSVKQVIETAQRATGKGIKAVAVGRRPGDPPVLIGSAEKAGTVLNWRPRYPDLDTIIRTAWEWHQVLRKSRP
jgi:UDP-glucose 4-epimerase